MWQKIFYQFFSFQEENHWLKCEYTSQVKGERRRVCFLLYVICRTHCCYLENKSQEVEKYVLAADEILKVNV
jgi:hypothetical protein